MIIGFLLKKFLDASLLRESAVGSSYDFAEGFSL